MVDGIVGVVLPGQDQLGDGHEGVPLLQQGLQDGGQGLRGVLGGIVEQDDGPGLDLGGHPLGDLAGREVLPVQGIASQYSLRLLRHNGYKALRRPEIARRIRKNLTLCLEISLGSTFSMRSKSGGFLGL